MLTGTQEAHSIWGTRRNSLTLYTPVLPMPPALPVPTAAVTLPETAHTPEATPPMSLPKRLLTAPELPALNPIYFGREVPGVPYWQAPT